MVITFTYLIIMRGTIIIPEFMKKTNPFPCFQVKFSESWYTGLNTIFAKKLHKHSIDASMENNEPVKDINAKKLSVIIRGLDKFNLLSLHQNISHYYIIYIYYQFPIFLWSFLQILNFYNRKYITHTLFIKVDNLWHLSCKTRFLQSSKKTKDSG